MDTRQSQSQSQSAALDVDAFKRLLLTGNSGQDSGLAVSTATEASSQQHHGGDTHPQHLPAGSGTGEKEEKKKKPPPPKTRHGNLIRSGGEADSTTSLQPPLHLPPSPATYTSSPSIQTEQSQSNKQTPRPPGETTASSSNAPSITSDQPQVSATPSSKGKRPPTPPLTRRHSQMKRGEPGISRSNSSRQIHGTGSTTLSRTASTSKNPPPPPSPRRLQSEPTASQSASISSGGQRPSSLSQDVSSETSASASTEHDDSEKSSLQRSDSGSAKEAAGTPPRKTSASNVPPRPPPRRRTGGATPSSNLNSSDNGPRPDSHDPSGASAGDKNRLQQLQHGSNSAEVLADLSRLQKEVDDLRAGQYQTRRPS